MYPRSWKKQWRAKKYIKPRIKLERNRRYDMPVPLCWGDTLAPQQYYFMKKTRTYVRGCATGSGLRENHSYYGLAFIEMSRRRRIPAYILVYDKDNALRFVDRIETFVIVPDSVGSNCHESDRTIQRLMKKAPKITAVRTEDYTEIDKIHVFS